MKGFPIYSSSYPCKLKLQCKAESDRPSDRQMTDTFGQTFRQTCHQKTNDRYAIKKLMTDMPSD